MNAAFDAHLSFPASDWVNKQIDTLQKLCRSIEGVEIDFDIEFSCGNNLYLSDIEDDDALVDRYDGEVCTESVPRFRDTNQPFKPGKDYRFTIKVYGEDEEEVRFYINGKERSRRTNY